MLPGIRRLARAARRAGRREGGRAAVPALPHARGHHGRLGARPRDALDRRGHGHRPRLPDRVRQEPGRRVRRHAAHRARCSSRSPTATSAPIILPGPPPAAARLRDRRDRGHRRGARAATASARARCCKFSDKPTADAASVVELINARRDRRRREHPERPLGPGRRLRDPRRGGRRRQARSSRRSPSSAPPSRRSTRCAAGFEVTSLQEYGARPGGGDAHERRRRDPLRRAAGGRVRGLRSPVRRHRPARRRCSRSGACPTPPRACASSACAWSRPRPTRSASSSRRSRSSSATAPRGTPRSSDVLARGARRRPARDRRRQARRHRLDHRRLRRGVAATRLAASRPTP